MFKLHLNTCWEFFKDNFKLLIYNIIFIIVTIGMLSILLINDYSQRVVSDEKKTTKEFEGFEMEFLCVINNCVYISNNGNTFKPNYEGDTTKLEKVENFNDDYLFEYNHIRITPHANLRILFDENSFIVIPGSEIFANVTLFVTWVSLLLLVFNVYIVFVEFKQLEQNKFRSHINTENQVYNNSLVILTENLHHEMNTPLTVITSKYIKFQRVLGDFSSMIDNIVENEYTEGLKEICIAKTNALSGDFNIVNGSLSQIDDILNRMKKFKYLKGDESERNIFEVLQTTFDIFLVTQSEKFEYKIDDNLKTYCLDVKHLRNGELTGIFINFLKNSVEHGNATFMEVRFKSFDSGDLEICYIDDGNGIKEEAIPNIFEVNYSTKLSTTESRGNGMYISKFLLEEGGGNVQLEKSDGDGVVFKMCLKTVEAPYNECCDISKCSMKCELCDICEGKNG